MAEDRQIFHNFARMKAKHILTVILAALMLCWHFSSCGVDRWAAYAEQTQTDRWIYDTMQVWYYWREDIPGDDDVNYFTTPFEFFESLLSSEDGKNGTPYSTIDSLTSNTRSISYTDYSYGFEFTTSHVETNDTAYYAHILYVASGSPADDAGLERGDWIMEMDGKAITEDNYELLYGSTAMQLTVGYYDAEEDSIIAYESLFDIASARAIDDNPVHYTNVYDVAGKQVGYLVYNHFSSGLTESGEEYNEDLRSAFREFASQQVNEFVLDLRYNNGGLLSCAQLLCSMLAPSSSLGQTLAYLEYNDNFDTQTLLFDNDLIGNGANLNLSTLYILTSDETASASEMLINCLEPYMDVVLIGATTEGKNVASRTFTNQELMIEMKPIVCKIYNSEGKSDYENGFSADVSANEEGDLEHFLPFGDPDELMLSIALGLIENGNQQVEASVSRNRLRTTVINNSVSRRRANSVRMD